MGALSPCPSLRAKTPQQREHAHPEKCRCRAFHFGQSHIQKNNGVAARGASRSCGHRSFGRRFKGYPADSRGLPHDFEAAILIVLHTADHSESLLPRNSQTCEQTARFPTPGTEKRFRGMYTRSPGFHMIVEDGRLRVPQGPSENLHRPAVDPLFRSAAASYGPRVIGVILTGMLDDGTAGLMVVRASGGKAIVQDPATALYPGMPRSALDHVPNTQVAPLPEIAALLLQLIRVRLPVGTSRPRNGALGAAKETRIAELDMNEISDEDRWGSPPLSLVPIAAECCGKLSKMVFFRFRCRVGHALTAKYLGAEQRNALETALWEALRALEESASLYRRLAGRATLSRHSLPAGRFEDMLPTLRRCENPEGLPVTGKQYRRWRL